MSSDGETITARAAVCAAAAAACAAAVTAAAVRVGAAAARKKRIFSAPAASLGWSDGEYQRALIICQSDLIFYEC